jgi:HEAT repeat protein
MTNSADKDISMEVLGNPALVSSRMEFRKIEAIEAELVNESDREVAKKLLVSFFDQEDPWVRARAAKVLYRLDSRAAVSELTRLVRATSIDLQIPGIWALGELATPYALELLLPLAWNKNKEVQKAAIRSLVQMEAKEQIPADYKPKVKNLLKELRYKTDWIL